MIFRSKTEPIYNSCDPAQITSLVNELKKKKISYWVSDKIVANRVLYIIYVNKKDLENAQEIVANEVPNRWELE